MLSLRRSILISLFFFHNFPALERAIVRFSYTAEQPDELSLVEGQFVRVIEKNLEDDGWWKGEVNGKTGVFPDNFVELLPPEEVRLTMCSAEISVLTVLLDWGQVSSVGRVRNSW